MGKTFEFTLPIGSVLTGDVMPNGNGERYEYHIESVLGQGGFGITYKVWCIVKNGQIRTKTYFAIKEHFVKGRCHRAKDGLTVEYSQEAADDVKESLKDFVKEGRLLQSICKVKKPDDPKNKGSQNIVPVNEVIEANNTAYFVMEYLDGGSLRDKILQSNTGMSEEKALSLIVPICQAVSFIHRHDILHMDIKPSNIVMRRNLLTTQEEPVLIDFGVSLHFDKKGSLTTKHTSYGRSEGFSPIEQYGAIENFQPKIDVYALAATLFYLLGGKVPPSAFNITTDFIEKNIPAAVSERTRRAIIHAMTKDSQFRTPSADAFIAELESRYTLPVGYILHSSIANYLITGINQVNPYYIKYDAVIYTGSNHNNNDSHATKTHQYVVYEYYVKGVFKRGDDESVMTDGYPYDEQFLAKIKKRTGLEKVGENISSDIHLECELFETNGTVYGVVDRSYKPASCLTKLKDNVTTVVKSKSKTIGKIVACTAGALFLVAITPTIIKAFQKTDEDWSRELTEAIKKNNLESLQKFADKDSARAVLPLAELLLAKGDTTNARIYAEKAFSGKMDVDTAEANRIIIKINDYVEADRLAKLEAARKDSLALVEEQQSNPLSQQEQQELAKKKEEQKNIEEARLQAEQKKEEALKKEEEKKKKEAAQKETAEKEAAQKMADQSYNSKKAMEYLNKGRDMENCKKAYEHALKADEKTKASVIKELRDRDFPFP